MGTGTTPTEAELRAKLAELERERDRLNLIYEEFGKAVHDAAYHAARQVYGLEPTPTKRCDV